MKLKNYWPAVIFPAVMALLLCQADRVSAALGTALCQCGTVVIPALFPFLVLSRILVSSMPVISSEMADRLMNRLFGVGSGSLLPLILSFLGGYPVGVSAVTTLYAQGRLTKHEAERALRLCNNSGPGIFIGLLGAGIFHDSKAGLALYLIHVTAALLTGLVTASPGANVTFRSLPHKIQPFPAVFLLAVTDTCDTLLHICGMILLFSLVPVLLSLLRLPSLCITLISGFTELTGGLLRLGTGEQDFVLAAFFTGWGGLCVGMQACSLWHSAGLTPKGCFTAKLIHGLLSAGISMIYLHPIPKNLMIGLLIFLIAVFSPVIRKKYSRKSKLNGV